MRLAIISFSILVIFLIFPSLVTASGPSFITIVNPVRGEEFWDQSGKQPVDPVVEQLHLLNSKNIKATWLLRFDALEDEAITKLLKNNPQHEKGLFLEITPRLSEFAKVLHRPADKWYSASSIFLTGYALEDRFKMIDALFENFKTTFGSYPKSVGAWWIDAKSLEYMYKKYGIAASLIVADQYSTDNYQIWGQYWAAPYYPFIRNALIPAPVESEKIPVVVIQWAQRDPFNGYGGVVENSTYSVQANDYIDYHNLGISYFGKLVDIYTKHSNPIGQLTIGLENSFSWESYGSEYTKQVNLLVAKADKKEAEITTMSAFASKYKGLFPKVSPSMAFFAEDPLDTGFKVLWFMNLYYRAGLFFDHEGVWFRDIREYSGGEELCLLKPCDKISFAGSFVSSVDNVAFGKSWLLDEGQATDIKVVSDEQKVRVRYTNRKGQQRTVELLPRDISVDGVPFTISGIILNVKEGKLPSKLPVDAGPEKRQLLVQRLVQLFISLLCKDPGSYNISCWWKL